ncbi:Acetyltransferase (GNAT) family protein [Halogranum amylolyticum]|uniref:Acetyltransferase (GNAT) family protein n=1 Tax=Halogranum amylolyticum TaxID=660520 RepID=A0A1H8S4Q6_9EURY|nr:GNAT family N-acetyltransferase [Halogranum amylolyticum]SEO73640.1 Acetyltransferase (GNAT) family protein [Halogranum amylolyticum]
MEFALLGWPDDEPTLRLDYRTFSYAGKFVMSTTGKAVVRDPDVASDETDPAPSADTPPTVDPSVFEDGIYAAVAFNEDRTDSGVLWLRYVTVHADHRGEGLAPRLAAFVADRAEDRGYRRLRIAVNNPFAYQAMYKAGFAYTGRQTGLAELVLERPGERDRPTYQCGLDVFRERDLSDEEREFLAAKERTDPPAVVDAASPSTSDTDPSPSASDTDPSPSASDTEPSSVADVEPPVVDPDDSGD